MEDTKDISLGPINLDQGEDEHRNKLITGRGLGTYEALLRLDRKLFEGQNVLNFGSGGSNLSGEVKKSGINANVVDLDIADNPDPGMHSLRGNASMLVNFVNSFVSRDSSLYESIDRLRQGIAGTAGRQFIQADGRHLPFADKTFDTTLALYSTYEVPDDAKEQVYGELLRVSNALHCGGIGEKDFEILKNLAGTTDYEIIYSDRMPIIESFISPVRRMLKKPSHNELQINNEDDYDRIKTLPPDKRLKNIKGKAFTLRTFGKPIVAYARPGLVVMRRKTS